jgi:flagellar assembly protein FliH
MIETPQSSGIDTEQELKSGAASVSSLRGFKVTPFSDANWEVVSAPRGGRGFAPLELDIIDSATSAGGSIFEDLAAEKVDQVQNWHGPKGSAPLASGSEEVLQREIEQLRAKVAQSFEEGRVQGQAEGQAAAEEALEVKLAEEKQRIEVLCKSLPEQSQHFFRNVEQQALQLALKIARKIIGTTVEIKPDYIVDVIRRAMESLGAAQPMRVRVSHQDLEFIQIVGLPPELSAEELGLEYVGDEAVKSGCVVETDFGEIDLQLDHMWEKVRNELAEICD